MMDESPPNSRRGPPLISYFDVSSAGFAWRQARREQINERRAAMDDKLIFDILLVSGGIRDPDFLYPPRDSAGLQRLLDAIESSTYDTLKVHSLVYFLLKWHQDGREERFMTQFCIPPQFAALADAYFYLDTGINVAKAVSILSDARLNRDYVSKIIHAISLSPNPAPLIRKYVRTAKPPLIEPPDLVKYTLALAESSLLEAWQFQRTFPETDVMRARLFNEILEWTVHPHPHPIALTQLVSLPLSKYEQSLLHEYSLNPPHQLSSSAVGLLQDLVCVRLIETGKYAEAIKMDKQFNAAGYSSKESYDRKTMIQDLYESLPAIEKLLIDAESSPIQKPKPQLQSSAINPAPISTPARDVTMSQSWEDVRVPDALSKSTNTPLRNIQVPTASTSDRIGTPRFTVPVAMSSTPAGTAPPIIPITTNGFASTSTPRKSLPFSSLPLGVSLLGSGRGRPSFSGVGNRLATGASPTVSSPASGMKFPLHPKTSPIPHAKATLPPVVTNFTSAATQSNAFYQPKQSNQKRPLEDPDSSPERTKMFQQQQQKEDEEDGEGMEMDQHGKRDEVDVDSGWKDDAGVQLNESIFSNRNNDHQEDYGFSSRGKVVPSSTLPLQNGRNNWNKDKNQKRLPPGAFVDEEDHDGIDEGNNHELSSDSKLAPASSLRKKPPTQPRSTKSRKSAAPPIVTATKTTRARRIKEQQVGRSLPGSLMDHDDDDDDPDDDGDGDHEGRGDEEDAEEEKDQVPPLRCPSPLAPPPPAATASRRPIRKSRSVASSDFGDDDGEGIQTRRRSSRLTTTATMNHLRNISPEPSKSSSGGGAGGGATKATRKSTVRTGGGKKKK